MSAPGDKSILSSFAEDPMEGVKGVLGLGDREAAPALRPQESEAMPDYPPALRDAERTDDGGELQATVFSI